MSRLRRLLFLALTACPIVGSICALHPFNEPSQTFAANLAKHTLTPTPTQTSTPTPMPTPSTTPTPCPACGGLPAHILTGLLAGFHE